MFTTKGWDAFPESTAEELCGGVCNPLFEGQNDPNWGTYMAGDHRVLVCGFQHPLFASREDPQEQVKEFLDLRASL